MRRFRFIPGLVLALGAAGAILRRIQLRTDIDPASGLSVWGWPSFALLALTLGAAVLVLAVTRSLKKGLREPRAYRRTFRSRSFLSFAVTALAGLVMAGAGLLSLRWPDLVGLTGLPRTGLTALMVLTGLAMVLMSLAGYTQREPVLLRVFSLAPAVFYCCWMVALYRMNAGNPVLTDFAYACVGLAAAAVGSYFSAGYAYGRRNLSGALFMGLGAAYLNTLTLADPNPLPIRLALAATAVFMTLSSARLMGSLRPKKRRKRKPVQPETAEQ